MKNDCVFCDRSNLEERLIAETDEYYIVATLGQITDGGYILLIPKDHIPCMGALAGHNVCSMVIPLQETYHALSSEYKYKRIPKTSYPVIIFEHGIVGQTIKHAHLHLMPAVIDLTPKIHADFPKTEIQELYSDQVMANTYVHLQESYKRRQEPYLFWTTPYGQPMVCWNPDAPPQYLRIVAAELTGRPERGNWRNMDPELDKQLWQETVTRLKPYFQSGQQRER